MVKQPLSERKLERVQFHTGVQFTGVVKTGITHKEAEIKLLGNGAVYVKTDQGEWFVSSGNWIGAKLLPEAE